MTDFKNSEDQERLQSYLKIHLKKGELSLSDEEKIKALDKKNRKKWMHFAINVAAILFFGYSFYYDITQLSQTFLIIILVIFTLNMGLIFYQRHQIQELQEYLKWKQQDGN